MKIVLCDNGDERCLLKNIFSNKKIWLTKSLYIFDKNNKDCKWKREEKTHINPSRGEVFYVTCNIKNML